MGWTWYTRNSKRLRYSDGVLGVISTLTAFITLCGPYIVTAVSAVATNAASGYAGQARETV